MTNFQKLSQWGWTPFFQLQLSLDEWSEVVPSRVIEQQKSILTVITDAGIQQVPIMPSMPSLVVGDWILLNQNNGFVRDLERRNYFKRKAAGVESKWQLLASNIDTAFVVSSLNDDFNLNRIERYLTFAREAEAEPVLVLTKGDLVDDIEQWQDQYQELTEQIPVIVVNALDFNSCERLFDWLQFGQTAVLLGSSGVGKSTITNTLSQQNSQATGAIRESDSKGRHTTSSRYLIPLQNGSLILDTPGMRELKLADCEQGIQAVFSDIEELAENCRFTDCQHNGEPGCNVQKAVAEGVLSQRKLDNYLKLKGEEARNTATLAERRAADKSLGKFYKYSFKESKKLRGRE